MKLKIIRRTSDGRIDRWDLFLAIFVCSLVAIGSFLTVETIWLSYNETGVITEEIVYLTDATTLELYSHLLAGSSGRETLTARYAIRTSDGLRIRSEICENTNVYFVEDDNVNPRKITEQKYHVGRITTLKTPWEEPKTTFVVPEGTIKRSFEMDSK